MKEFFKDFRDPKFWASICAWMVPISIAVLWGIGIYYCWPRSEIAAFIGAIAGPLAGLAGFIYIYINLIEQQKQFIQQQEQIQNQAFENSFFQLLNNFKNSFTTEFRGSWKTDITNRINSLLYELENDGFGGTIPHQIKEYSDLTLEELSNHLNSWEGQLLTILKAEFSPLLSVLFLIQNELESKSHFLKTLIYSINHNDKFLFFYSFLANKSLFSTEERAVLKVFFLHFPEEVFLDQRHKDFLNEIE